MNVVRIVRLMLNNIFFSETEYCTPVIFQVATVLLVAGCTDLVDISICIHQLVLKHCSSVRLLV